MDQPFPNIQCAVITAQGNGVNLPARELVIAHDTLIDMGMFCPMSRTFDSNSEDARKRLGTDHDNVVEMCREALYDAFKTLWQDNTVEVRFSTDKAASDQYYRLHLGHVVMGGLFWLHGVECQKVAEDKAAIAATGEWIEQSVHADTIVKIDPDRQMENLATGRHGHRHFDIRRAPGATTYHLFTWHHYDGEVPAGLRQSSGYDWDEAIDLATDWFSRGQRIN